MIPPDRSNRVFNGKVSAKRLRKTIQKDPRPSQPSHLALTRSRRQEALKQKRLSSLSILKQAIGEIELQTPCQRDLLKGSTSDVCFGNPQFTSKILTQVPQKRDTIVEEQYENDLQVLRMENGLQSRVDAGHFAKSEEHCFSALNEAKIYNAEEQDEMLAMFEDDYNGHCSKNRNIMTKRELKMIPRLKIGNTNSCCHICQDDFKKGQVIRKLFCEHKYHYSCVKPWFRKSSVCPVCRKDQKPLAAEKLRETCKGKKKTHVDLSRSHILNVPAQHKQITDFKNDASHNTPVLNFKKKNTTLDTNCGSNQEGSKILSEIAPMMNILDEVKFDFDAAVEGNPSMLQVELETVSRCSFATEMSLLNLLNDPVSSSNIVKGGDINSPFEMDLEAGEMGREQEQAFGGVLGGVCLGLEDTISVIQK